MVNFFFLHILLYTICKCNQSHEVYVDWSIHDHEGKQNVVSGYPKILQSKLNMADDLIPLIVNEDSNSSDEEMQSEDALREAEAEAHIVKSLSMSFDPSLPTKHTYLGIDLEEVSGRTVLEDDSCISLPLLSLPGVVLIPGQTLPLHLLQPNVISMMRHVMQTDRTFGLVHSSRYVDNEVSTHLASIGTTAEIYSYKEDTPERHGISTLNVKAMGRQRFSIVESRRQIDGNIVAKVRILPEKILPEPLEGASCASQAKFHIQPVKHNSNILLQNEYLSSSLGKYNRLLSANLTWWPLFVYKQYDVKTLMYKIRNELKCWNEVLKIDAIPKNPVDFSFWVAANLPIDDHLRLQLLQIDSAVQRLRCEYSIIKKCMYLYCRDCKNKIANHNDVFSMSLEGPMAPYVNPGGFVYETLTVYKAQNLEMVGRSSTENSWFPGYAWTILQCRQCSRHMGWHFKAEKKDLTPEKFWGLCRCALIPGLASVEGDGDDGNDDWAKAYRL